MVRTKQVARGGRPPKRTEIKSHTFFDHAGNPYATVGNYNLLGSNAVTVKLSIHLYFLGDVDAKQRETIGETLLGSDTFTRRSYRPRVDVYTPLDSIEDCIAHHRREKKHRRQAVEKMHKTAADEARNACGPDADEGDREEAAQEAVLALRGKQVYPHIVPTWCCASRFWTKYSSGGRYRSFILVVPADCHSWDDILEMGIFLVKFDQDITPAMESDMDDTYGEEEFSLLENDTTGWVYIEKVDQGPPIEIRRLSVADEYGHNALCSWRPLTSFNATSEEITGHLTSVWIEFTCQLWDCTYRIPVCDGCDAQVPHHDCEQELDEHFFDEDGQCIACRRFTEYRRRSKRISKKRKLTEISGIQ